MPSRIASVSGSKMRIVCQYPASTGSRHDRPSPGYYVNDVHADAAPGDVGDLLRRGKPGANISIATSSSLMFSLTVDLARPLLPEFVHGLAPPHRRHFNANVAALMFGRQN